MLKQLLTRMRSSLTKASITSCSEWAETYRVMGKPFPGPWTFDHHPWLLEPHNDTTMHQYFEKAAQMGFSELALNDTLYTIDVKRDSVLYVLPNTKPDANRFSTARFDPALQLSPHLKEMFSDVQNIEHKRAGSASLFVCGSRSRSALKSIPCAKMIFDELAEMDQANVVLAMERGSGQQEEDKSVKMISTPTLTNRNIDRYYLQSDQRKYVFKDPTGSTFIELDESCLVVTADNIMDPRIKDSHYISPVTKLPLNQADKPNFLKAKGKGGNAHWVPQFANRNAHGYSISQLYSCVLQPYEIAVSKLLAQTNEADEQEYYNSKLGVPHEVEGARLTSAMIDNCIGGYLSTDEPPGSNAVITMGIDVGKLLHITVVQYFVGNTVGGRLDINLVSDAKVLWIGTKNHFHELDTLMHKYGVNFAIIDNQPETRSSLEFCQRFWGRAMSCHYDDSLTARQQHINEQELRVNVNRTSWIDMLFSRYRGKKIQIPKDRPHDFEDHMKANARIYKKDKIGNLVGKYDKDENDADHYCHAGVYAEIALPHALSLAQSENIND